MGATRRSIEKWSGAGMSEVPETLAVQRDLDGGAHRTLNAE